MDEVDEIIFTHEILWRSSNALEDFTKNKPDDTRLLIPLLLSTFLAYEAFINFCGMALLPDLWEDEKKHFRGKDIEFKLGKLYEKIKIFKWEKDRRPYQTVRELQRFRNIAVHGKVKRNKYFTSPQPDGRNFRFEHDWDQFLTTDKVCLARSDTKQFCQILLESIRTYAEQELLDDEISDHFLFDAFEGPLASGSSSGPYTPE